MEYSKGSSALAISHTTQWHLQSNDGAFNLPKLVVCIIYKTWAEIDRERERGILKVPRVLQSAVIANTFFFFHLITAGLSTVICCYDKDPAVANESGGS